MKTAFAAAAAGAFAAALLGCGNTYFTDWRPSYYHELIRVGDPQNEVGARSLALGGAGRAGLYEPAAAVSNPAALAFIRRPSVSMGGGYYSRILTVQPGEEDPRAEASSGSFAPSFAAGVLPVAGGKVVLGGAAWVPNDYAYRLGKGAGNEIKSTGTLYAVGPTAATRWGPFALGFGADYLLGAQNLSFPPRDAAAGSYRSGGYDVRGAIMARGEAAPGWTVAACAFGRKGAALNVTGARSFDLTLPPAAGAALGVTYGHIAVYGDYIYTFYDMMRTGEPTIAAVLGSVVYPVGWGMAGAEYTTAGGAVARAGVAYRPWFIQYANGSKPVSLRYAMGGGWPLAGKRGRLDAALSYGRRGALTPDGYLVDELELALSFNYFW